MILVQGHRNVAEDPWFSAGCIDNDDAFGQLETYDFGSNFPSFSETPT